MPRHQNDSSTFAQLTYNEKRKSINAQVAIMTKAIRSLRQLGVSQGKNSDDILNAVDAQIGRMMVNYRR